MCYLGKTSHSTGTVETEITNAAVYITESGIDVATSTFGDKADVVSKHWKRHAKDSRTDIASEKDCAILTRLEKWHYGSYDPEAKICHLAMILFDDPVAAQEGSDQNVQINLELLGDLQASLFITRSSNLYSPFIYQNFGGSKDDTHCSMHCYFDPDDHCDFHFIQNDQCYLGNFNTQTPIASPSGSFLTFIFKHNVHDMSEKLFPTTTDAQQMKWTRHIRETLNVVSDHECAAHAVLYPDAPIDFYYYSENNCQLGDLSHIQEGTGDVTLQNVRIRKCKSSHEVLSL